MVTKTYYQKNIFWAGILLAQFVLFYIFSASEAVVGWFESFFEIQKNFHQRLFSGVPFSAGDLFYIILSLVLTVLILKSFKKDKRTFAVKWLLIFSNILYFIYQIFWGMLYFQTPISAKLSKTGDDLNFAKELAKQYQQLCRETREKAAENRQGVFEIKNLEAIKAEVIIGQRQIPNFISTKSPSAFPNFKESLFKKVMSDTGIMGYYNPFTAEAQYNPQLPDVALPFTLSHESAHQMGFAREQEANFIGYLIGKNSGNTELRYSTQYFVLKSLLNAIYTADPGFVEGILKSYSPKMKRDRENEKAFREAHSGWLDVFFGFTNDLFLKSNRQDGAVTYSYFATLLLRYEYTQTRK